MNWYEDDVRLAEKEKQQPGYKAQMIFYGSSSIRLWETLYEDFAIYKPLRLGFGGSTLEACVYFFERLLKEEQPQQLVIYAGDNDLGDGKQPQQVLEYFMGLYQLITKDFPDAQTFYISVKPSIARWTINDRIKNYNEKVQDAISNKLKGIEYVDVYTNMLGNDGKPVNNFYLDDGLHLSEEGYAVWKQVLLDKFSTAVRSVQS